MRHKDRASGWLTFLLILAAAYIAPLMLGYAGWYSRQPYRNILFYMPLQQLLLLPPVFYAYLKALLYPRQSRSTMHWLHFLPAIAYLLFTLWVFVSDIVLAQAPGFYADQRDMDFDPWYQWAGFISLAGYTLAAAMQYRRYREQAVAQWSYADEVRFSWIRTVLLLIGILLVLRVLFFVRNPEWAQFGRKFWYYASFGSVITFLGIHGVLHAVRWYARFPSGWTRVAEEDLHPEPTTAIEALETEGEMARLPDLPERMAELDDHMLKARPYAESLLTISDLAGQLGLPPKKLSQVINQGYHLNFNELINQYRVRAVVEKFEEGEHSLQTLLGIAYDCGFNSKSTFNRAFRKHTGLSPSAYLEKLTAK
jgi:AraC-like DNA-binding protein